MNCPRCLSDKLKLNGSVRGNKKAQCKQCKCRFVLERLDYFVEQKELKTEAIEALLLERMNLAGIAKVSESGYKIT